MLVTDIVARHRVFLSQDATPGTTPASRLPRRERRICTRSRRTPRPSTKSPLRWVHGGGWRTPAGKGVAGSRMGPSSERAWLCHISEAVWDPSRLALGPFSEHPFLLGANTPVLGAWAKSGGNREAPELSGCGRAARGCPCVSPPSAQPHHPSRAPGCPGGRRCPRPWTPGRGQGGSPPSASSPQRFLLLLPLLCTSPNQRSQHSPAILGVCCQILQCLIAGLCHAAVFPLEMPRPFGFLSSIHPSCVVCPPKPEAFPTYLIFTCLNLSGSVRLAREERETGRAIPSAFLCARKVRSADGNEGETLGKGELELVQLRQA